MHVEAMRTRRGIELPITDGDRNEQSHPVPFKGPGQDNCGSLNSNCGAGILWLNRVFDAKRDMKIASLEKGNFTTIYSQDELLLLTCLVNRTLQYVFGRNNSVFIGIINQIIRNNSYKPADRESS